MIYMMDDGGCGESGESDDDDDDDNDDAANVWWRRLRRRQMETGEAEGKCLVETKKILLPWGAPHTCKAQLLIT